VREEKFLTAFYYSLRNTLVANDLEQATRIAYNHSQRNRVVTLKGEIIEVSGTMSGGGQPLKGRMGSTIVAVEEFSAESIRMMQESVRDDEVQLRAVVDRRVELDTAVQTLKTQLDRAKVDLASFRTELSSAREQIKEYKKFEIVCLKKAKEAVCDEAKQAKLQEVVDKCRALFEKADEKAAKLRDENNELHEKIVEISKKILDEPKAALKKVMRNTFKYHILSDLYQLRLLKERIFVTYNPNQILN
jgi:structural maintenance of chromosome 4